VKKPENKPLSFREITEAMATGKVVSLQNKLRRPGSSEFEHQAEQIARYDAGAVGARSFMARLLVQVNMPHSKLKTNEFERVNGRTTIRMMAPRAVGLPYGTYPRLIMSWVTTEALRTGSPKLELGDSLSDFMRQLGLSEVTGGRKGTIGRLREHMERLFCSTISWSHRSDGHELGLHFAPVEVRELWWDPKSPKQTNLFRSNITLNQRFFEEIVTAPIPVDMRALRLLAHERSPLALDIYTWLTYRLWRLERPVCIPWESLQAQFGSGYRHTRQFKAAFVEQLQRVRTLYPGARVFPDKWIEPGLVLEPSPPHVAPRLR
jgi:hypothetical protein